MRRAYGIELSSLDSFRNLGALIFAVPHVEYKSLDGEALGEMVRPMGIVADVKSVIKPGDLRSDISYWSL